MLGDIASKEFQERIDSICNRLGLSYNGHASGLDSSKIPILELFKEDTVLYEENIRHETLLRSNGILIREICRNAIRRNQTGRQNEFNEEYHSKH